MKRAASPVTVVFPGAGGAVDAAIFGTSAADAARFETVGYPGWRRYVERGFSADGLISELSAEIAKRAPEGPVRIVGVSIGGPIGTPPRFDWRRAAAPSTASVRSILSSSRRLRRDPTGRAAR